MGQGHDNQTGGKGFSTLADSYCRRILPDIGG